MKKFTELTLEELKALYEKAAEEEGKARSSTGWRAENGERYYYVHNSGIVCSTTEYSCVDDNF